MLRKLSLVGVAAASLAAAALAPTSASAWGGHGWHGGWHGGGWFRRRGARAGGWSIAAIERNPQSLTAKASALSGRGFSAGFGEMEPVSAFM